MRKWRENEDMEGEWRNGERFSLYFSSFSLYFFPLYPFPKSNIVSFCRKVLNTALANVTKNFNSVSNSLWEKFRRLWGPVTVDAETCVDHSLVQICKLKFCQKTRFLLGPWAQGLVNILKVKFQQNLETEVNILLLMLSCGYKVESWSRFWS